MPMSKTNPELLALRLPIWLIDDFLQVTNSFELLNSQMTEKLVGLAVDRESLLALSTSMTCVIKDQKNILDKLRLYWGFQFKNTVTKKSLFPLSDIIRNLLNQLGDLNKKVEIEAYGEEGALVNSSRSHLQTIISELLINALQNATKKVRVMWKKTGDVVQIDIIDDGSGFDSDLLENIGVPFIRDQSNPSGGGLGLGIYISKELADRLGHVLHISSQAGFGGHVSVLINNFDDLGAGTQESLSLSGTDYGRALKILILDEDQALDKMIVYLLETWGCIVDYTGATGMSSQNVNYDDYAVILCGEEWVDAVKNVLAQRVSAIPAMVIVMLAPRDNCEVPQVIYKNFPKGACCFFLKRPVSPRKLKDLLDKAIHVNAKTARCY